MEMDSSLKAKIESVCFAKGLPAFHCPHCPANLHPPKKKKRDKCSGHPSLKKRLYYVKLHLVPGPHLLW